MYWYYTGQSGLGLVSGPYQCMDIRYTGMYQVSEKIMKKSEELEKKLPGTEPTPVIQALYWVYHSVYPDPCTGKLSEW